MRCIRVATTQVDRAPVCVERGVASKLRNSSRPAARVPMMRSKNRAKCRLRSARTGSFPLWKDEVSLADAIRCIDSDNRDSPTPEKRAHPPRRATSKMEHPPGSERSLSLGNKGPGGRVDRESAANPITSRLLAAIDTHSPKTNPITCDHSYACLP